MKKINSTLISAYTSYAVNSQINASNITSSIFSANSSSVFIDNNSLINDLQRNITFKNDLVIDSLLTNQELLNCLTESLNLICQNGIYFHADLDLITDDPNEKPQLLLVYYPLTISKTTNISIQKELSDTPINNLYRSLIRNLYKYSILIRKTVIIDEQIL